MTIRRSDATRNTMITSLSTDRGINTEIQVRSGINAGAGGQGALLAQLTGNAAGWGAAVNGVLTSAAITSDLSADATGIAGHYQINTAASVFLESGLLDGTDGVTINNPNIVLGQQVDISGDWVNTAAYDDGI